MGRVFTFSSRIVQMQFFEEDPVTITMLIGDETDSRILKSGAMISEADKIGDIKKRLEQYRAALELLIGAEHTAAILDRADELDSYAIFSVYRHVLNEYGAQKAKNLSAPAR